MTQNEIIAFSKHLVKRNTRRRPVRIPALNGYQLDLLLRSLERLRGYHS